MPKMLWTPDRDINLDVSGNVRPIPSRDMQQFVNFHAVAQKYQIVLACLKCRQPFQGLNSGTGTTQAVSCGCRELRATLRNPRG